MTNEKILELSAGPILDGFISLLIFKNPVSKSVITPAYSTDIKYSFEILDHLDKIHFLRIELKQDFTHGKFRTCIIGEYSWTADKMPESICKAAINWHMSTI